MNLPDYIDNTFAFLPEEKRALLRANDLTNPDAYKHVSVADLRAEPFLLSLGRASQVLAAAGVGNCAPAGVTNVHVTHAEPPDVATRIDRALRAAHDDSSKAGALVDLGVTQVVLQADDKIDLAETTAMRAHAAAGAPVGVTWKGQRIAETATLSTPPIWCSPRTHKPLQAGCDEITGTAWAELKLDGLCVAAYGYENGMFEGLSEEIVLERLKANLAGGGLRARVETHMRATNTPLSAMEKHVVFNRKVGPVLPTVPHGVPRIMTDVELLAAIDATAQRHPKGGEHAYVLLPYNYTNPNEPDPNRERLDVLAKGIGWITRREGGRVPCVVLVQRRDQVQ